MKKLTIIIAGFFLLIATSAFTPVPSDVSFTIKAGFEKDFASVSNVKWTTRDGLYLATFKENGSEITAAYSEEGELLVTGKYITLADLPENVSKSLKNKYSGYAITNRVIEITTTEKWYLVDVQNDKALIRLNCDASGSISIESKTKK